MADVKLSATQQTLFDAMKSGVTVYYSPYMGTFNPTPYYWRSDNFKRVTSAAEALITKGLAVKAGQYRNIHLVLKEAP